MHMRIFWLIALIITLLSPMALGSNSMVCDRQIANLGLKTFVPKQVLYKIARLETGRNLKGKVVSWPWSLNNSGTGYYFADKHSALIKLKELVQAGQTNIDIGCMQLNARWHKGNFDDWSSMMDPGENVQYAAKFLEKLFSETGSWEKTVKYYHSRNPAHHARYFDKFNDIYLPNDYASHLQEDQENNITKKFSLFGTAAEVSADGINVFSVPNFSLFSFNKAGRIPINLRDFRVNPLFDM